MELQKLAVKFFVEPPNAVPLTDFIEIFHGWIQATDGVYHDVADYSHMYAGPGIILVAKDANIAIDESGGRRGLVYTQKGLLVGSNRDLLRHAFRAALKNCRKLEEEPALSGKLRFAANEAVISLNDRLLGDNTRESFESIEGDVGLVSTQLFGGTAAKLERDNDPRQRLNFHVKTSALVSVAQALENLSRN
jgi:hypothetical protein